MDTTGQSQTTHFARPERDSFETVSKLADELNDAGMVSWLDAVPMAVVVINKYRQILFCNDLFRQLTLKQKHDDVLGLRPGEALDCVNAGLEKAGCGCSFFCDVCGAARAIIKSLDGESDCQECRMVRRIEEAEVPLDLQVFSKPLIFQGQKLSLIFALDISHELRLRYLNRTFYHGLINSVGGIATLTELIEAEPDDSDLFPLLIDSSRRTLRDVLYHRDLFAAETGKLKADPSPFEARPYLEDLIATECRLRNMQSSRIQLKIVNETNLFSDKRLLRHALRNMLVNAMEAGEDNPGAITLTCRVAGTQAQLSLENPGIIPEDIQKEIFKRYVSTKSRDRGLGTYVIKLLIESYLEGEVHFASGNGVTRFTITIPAQAGETA